jgi:hypothetical protein
MLLAKYNCSTRHFPLVVMGEPTANEYASAIPSSVLTETLSQAPSRREHLWAMSQRRNVGLLKLRYLPGGSIGECIVSDGCGKHRNSRA